MSRKKISLGLFILHCPVQLSLCCRRFDVGSDFEGSFLPYVDLRTEFWNLGIYRRHSKLQLSKMSSFLLLTSSYILDFFGFEQVSRSDVRKILCELSTPVFQTRPQSFGFWLLSSYSASNFRMFCTSHSCCNPNICCQSLFHFSG